MRTTTRKTPQRSSYFPNDEDDDNISHHIVKDNTKTSKNMTTLYASHHCDKSTQRTPRFSMDYNYANKNDSIRQHHRDYNYSNNNDDIRQYHITAMSSQVAAPSSTSFYHYESLATTPHTHNHQRRFDRSRTMGNNGNIMNNHHQQHTQEHNSKSTTFSSLPFEQQHQYQQQQHDHDHNQWTNNHQNISLPPRSTSTISHINIYHNLSHEPTMKNSPNITTSHNHIDSLPNNTSQQQKEQTVDNDDNDSPRNEIVLNWDNCLPIFQLTSSTIQILNNVASSNNKKDGDGGGVSDGIISCVLKKCCRHHSSIKRTTNDDDNDNHISSSSSSSSSSCLLFPTNHHHNHPLSSHSINDLPPNNNHCNNHSSLSSDDDCYYYSFCPILQITPHDEEQQHLLWNAIIHPLHLDNNDLRQRYYDILSLSSLQQQQQPLLLAMSISHNNNNDTTKEQQQHAAHSVELTTVRMEVFIPHENDLTFTLVRSSSSSSYIRGDSIWDTTAAATGYLYESDMVVGMWFIPSPYTGTSSSNSSFSMESNVRNNPLLLTSLLNFHRMTQTSLQMSDTNSSNNSSSFHLVVIRSDDHDDKKDGDTVEYQVTANDNNNKSADHPKNNDIGWTIFDYEAECETTTTTTATSSSSSNIILHGQCRRITQSSCSSFWEIFKSVAKEWRKDELIKRQKQDIDVLRRRVGELERELEDTMRRSRQQQEEKNMMRDDDERKMLTNKTVKEGITNVNDDESSDNDGDDEGKMIVSTTTTAAVTSSLSPSHHGIIHDKTSSSLNDNHDHDETDANRNDNIDVNNDNIIISSSTPTSSSLISSSKLQWTDDDNDDDTAAITLRRMEAKYLPQLTTASLSSRAQNDETMGIDDDEEENMMMMMTMMGCKNHSDDDDDDDSFMADLSLYSKQVMESACRRPSS